jgi:peptidylprolyl isomerase
MRSLEIFVAATTLLGAAEPAQLTPPDIVAAAPASAWRTIPADDLLVMDLKDGGRIIIQLAPLFAPVHAENLRALAKAGWWDGAAIYRVQDNYVAQWGNNESDKSLPAGVVAKPPAEYSRPLKGLRITPLGSPDPYAPAAGFVDGWAVAYSPKEGQANLAHCYAMVGVGRDLSPDTGTGGELYAVIGHATRQLDRNIALVGRVVEGIDRLSSLQRGTEALGFYKERTADRPITRVSLATQMTPAERPSFEYLASDSASFAAYLRLRAYRKDAFYDRPAGGVDLCNVTPPVRRKP